MESALAGKDFLDGLASSLSALLAQGLVPLFGPAITAPVLGPISWADLAASLSCLAAVLLLHALAAAYLRRKRPQPTPPPGAQSWRPHLLAALGKPLYLLLWLYGLELAATPLLLKLPATTALHPWRAGLHQLFGLGVLVVLFWLFFRLTRVLEARLGAWAGQTSNKLDDLLVPLLGRCLRVLVPVLALILALPLLELSPAYAGLLAKASSLLLIGTVAWLLFQAVHLGEQAVLAKYDLTAADNLQARKVYTQVHVLSKTLYVVIALFTAASMLMLFEEVRRFGTSLLASAGVVGIIIGFAAQRTMANLFAGFQLALTQPIRLDDVVIVEGEWGRVEEITLTYVVIRIWDERRLIVPLSHFIEKPFQNWTRVSANLLGSVFLWVDYSLPLEAVRAATRAIVESSPLWDKRFWNLVVTDTNERAMQIRVLATAADSAKAWDLRCEIREKLIAYIQAQFPQGLPRLRAELEGPAPAANALTAAGRAPSLSPPPKP